MQIKHNTHAQCECRDEKGTSHAFAAFLNMQFASTSLCVCSCCLLTLGARLHVFRAQERTRKTAKRTDQTDKYGMKNISRPSLWKYIPVASASHAVGCPKPCDPKHFFVLGLMN